MSPSTEFEFLIGEKYENEKGPFKVVSIEKDEMLIRWADGEEMQTSIEFQGRIQERRKFEKAREEKAAAPAKPAPRKAKSSKTSKKAPPAQ
jgi:hypothetical protein